MLTTRSLFPRRLAVASLAALGLLPLMTACGGKKGNKPATPVNGNPSAKPEARATVPEGLWLGTLTTTSGVSHDAYCLVSPSGDTRVVVEKQLLIAVKLNKGEGEGQYMALGLNSLSGGPKNLPASVKVTAFEAQKAFSGIFKTGKGEGSFTFNKYEPIYDKALEPAALTGTYLGSGEMRTIQRLEAPRGSTTSIGKIFSIELHGDGSLTGGKKDGFALQGTYSTPSKDKAGLQLDFTYTPAEGGGVVEQFQAMGLANTHEGKSVLTVVALGEHDGLILAHLTRNEPASPAVEGQQ